MKRAVRRFVSKLHGKNKYLFFISLILIMIVATCLGIYIQFFYKYSDTDPLMLGITIGMQKTAEEYAILKTEFNDLFTNEIKINSENVRVDKIEPSNALVYTGYNLVNEDENYYSVNAQVPVINIDTDKAKQINGEIKSEFYDKVNSIMRQTEKNTVYTVSYAAFVNEHILSVVVKSSLKEEGKSEKVVVKTYNYSIAEEKLLSLNDLIELKQTTKETVQTTIKEDIKLAYTNAKIIAEEYGILYERDLEKPIYQVDNTTTFFLTQDGYVYIVYAYGNYDYTNEMDVIIF